jgi:PAS domain S-box-containing protein
MAQGPAADFRNLLPVSRTDSRKYFRFGEWKIGARLTACFLAIVLLMIVGDTIAVLQLDRVETPARRFYEADQKSLAITQVHLDVVNFRETLTGLAHDQNSRQFVSQASSLRDNFLRDVRRAQQTLSFAPDVKQDPTILTRLETVRAALASQVDAMLELVKAGDWEAVRFRLASQVQPLIGLSSLLVADVHQEVARERAQALESTQRARRQLYLVLPVVALLILLVAAILGWYATRTISKPLALLDAGAQALARGEFGYEVQVRGNDELADLARAFNYAAQQLHKLYDVIKRSEAYLTEAQRLSLTGSFGWRPPTGEIFWSEETFRIFEYDPVTTPSVELVLDRVHPEDRDKVQQQIDHATRDGKDFDLEYRLLMPGGSLKHVHVVAHTLKGESGSVEFVGAVKDVTAAKQVEEKIRQQEMELRQIVDLAPQLVAVFGPRREHLYANRVALDYLGTGLEEWRRIYDPRWLHPDDYERINTRIDSSLSRGVLHEHEVRLRKSDGSYRWFLARYNPLCDEEGRIKRWYVAFTDIEDRKQAEDRLQQENVVLREEVDKASMFEEIVGVSPILHVVLSRVSKVAPEDSTVLITGETGTGKELLARAIHKRSPRCSRAFVSANCAAIPQNLIASELFGHEKGAFTGALQRRLGRFEVAEGGIIFLDEVGDLPAETQIALLRVLQEHEFERVGGNQPIRSDVRVIAATNRDLQTAIAAGAFRSDLFYRLNVFPLEMPPLRERTEDIPLLVEYFVDRYASKTGKKIRSVHRKTLELLQSYAWPGNIRELQNVIERSVIVCETETLLVDESWLPREPAVTRPASKALSKRPGAEKKQMIEAALAETRGRVSGPSGAAAKLGVPASTLESKIRALKINKYQFRTA